MKKLLIFVLVLGTASLANADLKISVGGVVDPQGDIILNASDYVTIDVMGDDRPQPLDAFLVVQNAGSIAGRTMLYQGSLALYQELEDFAAGAGVTPAEVLAGFVGQGYIGASDLSFMTFADGAAPGLPLSGTLVDNIIFHCEGPGNVLLTLVSADLSTVFDTQTIIQPIPEPMTITLLGLGGLLLRRRKK